ncbi:uncharacterized protein NDAI_0J02080 [Naumovozyma dairenensis CBS 421]|uniref:Uncharacterized protein n=1 Tax=Naumovozyma dairenensis (strain ATCC 10597 / BCRC 20456 / CBS 421 / NBRC 0211 / NRRL Y-12639) TaxID=1071378 RepID=G0WH22_NAUDC|nr:hypothetical protein NDAI_0J02080 [Naumovozyma dairenensis CBS 421]CCD27100.1 hypothetical protein NDAI_0J02080 [Naumovozyma dairenensis CBS 421]
MIVLYYILLQLLLFITTTTWADIIILEPKQNAVLNFGKAKTKDLSIKWTHSEEWPKQEEIIKYTFILCAGPNTQIQAIATLDTLYPEQITQSPPPNGHQFQVKLKLNNMMSVSGYYYVQIFAQTVEGYTIHYTHPFYIKGMKNVVNKLPFDKDVKYPEPPAEHKTTLVEPQAPQDPINLGKIPYHKQTGLIKYAPVQTQPKTFINVKKSWVLKNPKTIVTMFVSPRSSIDMVTTVTPGWNYIINNQYNLAKPAKFPSENGGWYSRIITAHPRKVNRQNK